MPFPGVGRNATGSWLYFIVLTTTVRLVRCCAPSSMMIRWPVGLLIGLANACFPLATPPLYYPTQNYYSHYPYAASKTRAAAPTHSNPSYANSFDDPSAGPLTVASSADNIYKPGSDCVQRFENQKLQCVAPIERRLQTSENECQQLCDQLQCKAYQFDALQSSCDVFDVDQYGQPRSPFAADDAVNDGGFKKRARRHVAGKTGNIFDEFLRDPLRNMPNGQAPAVYCDPALVPALGVTYSLVDEDCKLSIKSGLIKQPEPSDAFVGSLESISKTDPPTPKAQAARNPPSGGVQLVIPEMPDCPDGSRAKVQLVEGVEVEKANAITTVQLDSPDACLQICRMNSHLDGTRFKRVCRSAAFDRSSGKCYVYEEVISPNGDLNYTPNPNSVYFEKFCITGVDVPPACDDVIHRIPQHALDKRAIGTGAVVTAATQTDCIRHCLNSKVGDSYNEDMKIGQRHHGFECRAVSYFFDWPAENCLMSRFTRLSRPDIYMADRKDLVDYLELASCMYGQKRQRDSPTPWSEWSRCDETLTRTRRRNCTSCSPIQERAPCISETAFQEEFPRELLQAEKDPKQFAQNFDAARRYKQSKQKRVDSKEAALFGEQDYDNQAEVSFFGPPAKESQKPKVADNDYDNALQAPSNLFSIKSSIKRLRPDEATRDRRLESQIRTTTESESVDAPFKAPLPEELGFSNNNSEQRDMAADQLDLFRRAQAELDDVEDITDLRSLRVPKESKTELQCDPKVKCCPRPNGATATLRGCVIGYRIDENQKTQYCKIDDYCSARSSAYSACPLLIFMIVSSLY